MSFSRDSFCETAALLLLDRSSFPIRDKVEGVFFASASEREGRGRKEGERGQGDGGGEKEGQGMLLLLGR